MEPVDHQTGQRHALAGESLGEVGRLADRVGLGCGDHEEGRLVGLQQPVGRLGALPEAAEDGVEGGDEGLDVGQELAAQDLRHRAGDQGQAGSEDASRAACRRHHERA